MQNQEEFILAINTCPDEKLGREIAYSLVSKKLAAGVSVVPGAVSIYEWKDKIEEASECFLIIRTKKRLFNEICEAICHMHPYELPEITAVPITDGLPDYLTWINTIAK